MKLLFSFLSILFATCLYAQNVGIGTTNPVTKLDVNGSFKVSAEYVSTTALPTEAQKFTMINASLLSMPVADSIANVYDPGGPGGNYIANLNSTFRVNANNALNSYLELTVESIDLGTGDSLIVYDGSSATSNVLYSVGNGFAGNNISVSFSSNQGFVAFKSNGDASTGIGFSLLFKRKFLNAGASNQSITTGSGLVFYPAKAALRSGAINASAIGEFSTASGWKSTASGIFSTAMGEFTNASGNASTAMGNFTDASGDYSIAIGSSTDASGDYSIAIGRSTNATGNTSTAMGYGAIASGFVSTAMGDLTNASGEASTAMGEKTTASGLSSTAMGFNTIASGENATAIGQLSDASGLNSIAMGYSSIASGNASTAMGYESVASGFVSTSMGSGTIASGTYSTAIGRSTLAKAYLSLAIGRHNDTLTTESETTWQGTDRVFVIGDGTSNTARSSCFYILKNGNGWMQGTLTQASDARLKKDILKIEKALPKLKSLSGYNYHWINDEAMPELQAGLIAQEVQKQMPELVSASNEDGELAVNYSGMVPYLLEGIKEQQEEIDMQDKRLKSQEEKIKQMESELKAIKKLLHRRKCK